jgi:hypothetical protein
VTETRRDAFNAQTQQNADGSRDNVGRMRMSRWNEQLTKLDRGKG